MGGMKADSESDLKPQDAATGAYTTSPSSSQPERQLTVQDL